jgi:light-harvesting protein B-800-850 alpha chain
MNNAKLWLVVSPNVGIPLLLTAVAASSFTVHYMMLNNASWLRGYYDGNPISGTASAAVEGQAPMQNAGFLADGGQVVLITMPDGTTARAILQTPETLALNSQ